MNGDRYRTRSLILRTRPGEPQAQTFADRIGWPYRGEIPADPDRGIPYEVQWQAGPGLTLHYLEDDISESSGVAVTGDDPQAAEALARLAENFLDIYSHDDLLGAAAQPGRADERARALVRAGAGAPRTFDDRLFSLLERSFTDPEPAVREAAAWATTYVPHPQYRALLAGVVRGDPERRLRDLARQLMEGFDAEGISEL